MADDDQIVNIDLEKDVGSATQQDLLTNPNSLTFELTEESLDSVQNNQGIYTQPAQLVGGAGSGSTSPYTAPSVTVKKLPDIMTAEHVIVFDSETTGVNPWDYQILGYGFWDLAEDKSQMVQFFGWDEEEITRQAIEWLNSRDVKYFLGYNQAFDQRAILTRAMLYGFQCPCLFTAQVIDLMDLLKKGTPQSLASSQATGSVEDWELYFWNDKKPYTIEECFEGIRNHDLTRLQLRNRSCVTGEGDLWLLMRWISGSDYVTEDIPHPTVEQRSEELTVGIAEVQCPKCLYMQPFDLNLDAIHCIICNTLIPNPEPDKYLLDVDRPLDYEKVGLKTTKTTTTAKT